MEKQTTKSQNQIQLLFSRKDTVTNKITYFDGNPTLTSATNSSKSSYAC